MSQADAASQEQTVWMIAGRTGSKVYHTDPDCHLLDDAHTHREARAAPLSKIGDRRICKFCGDDFEPATNQWDSDECRHCGAHAPNGHCQFCQAFDEIHGAPTGADVDPAPWPGEGRTS